MEHVFIELLNMSITASWLVLAIIVFRFLFKKAPKALTVALWALVGIRLICPVSLESVLSLIPSNETIPQDIVYTENPTIHTGFESLNSTINPIISDTFAPNVGDSVNPMQVIVFIASNVWVLGMICMMLYTFISYWSIHRKVRESVRIRDNVWMCDRIDTPFILGVFRPQIYLPSNMGEQDVRYVLAHEEAHIKRHDHWWKPIGFALLTVYWFNPILWIAYVLLCRDIELACDEKVIKEMGEDMKKSYSDALINCSVPRKAIAACPLAFGEVGVKERIKSVLSYKKPTFWVISIAVVVSVLIAVCFMTNPKDVRNEDTDETSNSNTSNPNAQDSKIVKWINCWENLDVDWNSTFEIILPGTSNVKLQWKEGDVSVIDDNGTKELIGGMAVSCMNAYFCDLTGDGVSELCATVSVGSGWIDERIWVYDYTVDKIYELEDRWNYSYFLSIWGDELVVSKVKVNTREPIIEQGALHLSENNQTGEMELSYWFNASSENNPNTEEFTLSSGIYIAGIKPEDADPTSGALSGQYFHLNTDTRTFRMGGSIAMSFAIFGTYEFDGSKLTLTTDADNPNSYVFYLNEKGGFVYNESESNVEEHNWIKDGLVFGLRSTK